MSVRLVDSSRVLRRRKLLLPSLNLSTSPREITDMLIAALRAQSIQCFFELIKIIDILTTRPTALDNMLS